MKKAFTILLAAAMLTAFPATAFAAEVNQNGKDADVTVSTEINPTYTVTIPETTTIAFGAASTKFGSIELDAAQIHPKKAVQVSVTPGELKNKIDESKTLPYKVMMNETDEFTSATYTTKGESTDLTIAIEESAWNAAFAGKYEGTVTFTVEYVDA